MPTGTPTGVADQRTARQSGEVTVPLGARVLGAHIGLLNPDRARMLLTLHLESGAKLGVKISREMATQLAAEIARIEGNKIVRAGSTCRCKGGCQS